MRDLAARKDVRCVQVPGLGREIRPWSDAQALWGLYRMMRALRPDIVHTHTAKAGHARAARRRAWPASARSCTRTTATCCAATSAPRATAVFRALETALARVHATSLIAVSAAVKDDLVALGVAPARTDPRHPPRPRAASRWPARCRAGSLRREARRARRRAARRHRRAG